MQYNGGVGEGCFIYSVLLQLAVPGCEGVCLKVPHVQAVVQHCI